VKLLVAYFDVTSLTDAEIDALTGEVGVQAEASSDWPAEGHPDCPFVRAEIVNVDEWRVKVVDGVPQTSVFL